MATLITTLVLLFVVHVAGIAIDPDSCHGTVLSNGVFMPLVGFGTAASRGTTTTQAVTLAIQHGFRHFDTAEATEWYDAAAVGVAINRAVQSGEYNRGDFFVTSKLHPKNHGPKNAARAIDEMLQTMDTTYLDLLLIHFPQCNDSIQQCRNTLPEGTWKDSWIVMEDYLRHGKVRAIGVSNFDVGTLKQLEGIATVMPHVIQNWFDPFHQDGQVVTYAREHGIAYVAYSTLGGQWSHRPGVNRNLVYSSDEIRDMASRHGVSVSTLVLSWALQAGIGVLPRSSTDVHIQENAELLSGSVVQFTEHDLQILDNVAFDLNENCPEWASEGECDANPAYMSTHCAKSCRAQQD